MFRKLVSNLPFSPSLGRQLGFYSKRLRGENATRRIGLILTVMMLVVQSITLIAPAKPTLASSANDIVYGGNGKTQNSIYKACVNNKDALGRQDIQIIFAYYGISCDAILTGKLVSIHSSPENNYWSIGRSPRGYGGESSVQIPAGPRIYQRTLHGWAVKDWSAIEINTTQGTRWILLECGNVVFKPTPPPPTVRILSISCSTLDMSLANKTILTKSENVALTGTARGQDIDEGTLVDMYYDVTDLSGKRIAPLQLAKGVPFRGGKATDGTKRIFQLANNGQYKLTLSVKHDGSTKDAYGNAIGDCAKELSVVIPVENCTVPGKETLPKDSPLCTNPKPRLEISKASTDELKKKVGDSVSYKIIISNTGDTIVSNIIVKDTAPAEMLFSSANSEYQSFGKQPGLKKPTKPYAPQTINYAVSGKKGVATYQSAPFALAPGASTTITLTAKIIRSSNQRVVNTACLTGTGGGQQLTDCDDENTELEEACATNPKLPAKDSRCYPPCPYEGKQNIDSQNADCVPCDEQKKDISGNDVSCLELHKKARNITKNIADANGTVVEAGDTIEYTLSVTNHSQATRQKFVMEENMSDVLEYSDIIDKGGATLTEVPLKMLSWPPVDIKAGDTISKTILIKVKSPVPNTPASSSDPSSFDSKLTNIYGDVVVIDLPRSPIKIIEQTVVKLPSTGIGGNTLVAAIVLAAATYFYFRSKLMVKEIGLVRQEFNYAAGA